MTDAMLRTVLVVTLVVLAGCSGTVPDGLAGPSDATTTHTDDGTVDAGDDPAPDRGESGTVRFYLSDEPNAIGDFAHLNVTVSAVGFHRVGGDDADDGGDDGAGDDGDGTTATPDDATTTSGTAATTSGTATTTIAATTADNATATEDGAESDGGDDGANNDDAGGDGSGGGEWATYEVRNATVDLTRLVGANATRIADLDVPAGSYDAVFVYVEDVEATLTTGEEVRVKLPSGKLQLHTRFSVGANASVDFVYDIAVHEAGKSGKYVLRPVVSESGAGVPVEEVDGDEGDGDEGDDHEQHDDRDEPAGEDRDDERTGDDDDATDESALNVTLVGTVPTDELFNVGL